MLCDDNFSTKNYDKCLLYAVVLLFEDVTQRGKNCDKKLSLHITDYNTHRKVLFENNPIIMGRDKNNRKLIISKASL